MGKGQDLSKHQRGIVRRYYEHRDTIALQKLSEIVSDLWVCEGQKKAAALWKSAATALKNAGADAARAERIVQERNLKGLADLVNELQN
jgi:hypothetical protein